MSPLIPTVLSSALPELTYPVLIEQHGAEQWSAQVLGWAESRVEGMTREAALLQLTQQLAERLAKAEVVQLRLTNPHYQNPWLKLAGKYKEDPQFEEMLAYIAADRQALDADADLREDGVA